MKQKYTNNITTKWCKYKVNDKLNKAKIKYTKMKSTSWTFLRLKLTFF